MTTMGLGEQWKSYIGRERYERLVLIIFNKTKAKDVDAFLDIAKSFQV